MPASSEAKRETSLSSVASGLNKDNVHDVSSQHTNPTLEKEEAAGAEKTVTGPPVDDSEYPSRPRVILIMLSIMAAVLLIALDKTIIATAIPSITNEFGSLGDVGWYGAGYTITSASTMLFCGRLYTLYNPKIVFLSGIALFELGSAVCGSAPSSKAFIVGRAIAGMGGASTFSGAVVIIVHSVPLHKRPMYTGFMGAVAGIASVAGPLLGGAFTDKVTWRWCFYINLPIGAVAMAVIAVVLKLPDLSTGPQEAASTNSKSSFKEKVLRLDPIGTMLFLPGTLCLLLALQWGGTKYAWSSWRVILCLTLAAILLIGFAVSQVLNKTNATIPPRFFKQRSVTAATLTSFFITSHMMIVVYYVPLWLQAIQNKSAVDSGLFLLALLLPMMISGISTGILTRKTGYYVPPLIFSVIMCSIGTGLFTTFTVDTPKAHWLGFQAIYGLGLGAGMQQPSVAVQTVLSKADVPTGAAMVFFARELGGSVFLSVGQNIFFNGLTKGLKGVSGLDGLNANNLGATQLRTAVPQAQLGRVLDVYNGAVVKTFVVATVLAPLVALSVAGLEWRSVKEGKPPSAKAKKGGEAKQDVEKANEGDLVEKA